MRGGKGPSSPHLQSPTGQAHCYPHACPRSSPSILLPVWAPVAYLSGALRPLRAVGVGGSATGPHIARSCSYLPRRARCERRPLNHGTHSCVLCIWESFSSSLRPDHALRARPLPHPPPHTQSSSSPSLLVFRLVLLGGVPAPAVGRCSDSYPQCVWPCTGFPSCFFLLLLRGKREDGAPESWPPPPPVPAG